MQFSIFNRIFCLTLMIFLFLFTPNAAHAHGVLPAQDPSPLVAHGTDKRGLLALTLRADRAIAPGEVVTLVVETTPTVDAERLTIQWLLPDGGELVGSAATVLPRIVAKERTLLQRQVRFPTAGIYQVSVVASYAVGEPLQVSAAGVLVFTVQPDGAAAVSHHDPRIDITQQRRIPTTVTVEESVRTADANGDPCFTINGTVTRLERTPLPTGMPPYMDSRVPVRNVPVDMMEEDTLFDDYYGTKLTDANGNFNFSFCDDDGWFDDELELYVLLRAEIWDGQGRKVVEVVDSSWIDEVHEFESGRQDSEGGTLRFDMTMDLNHNPANIAAGATFQSEVFNIAEAAYRAWLFWNTNGGAVGDDAIFANTTTLHYEPGYDDDGSYYDPFWNEITIADAPSDPDAWDDSVVIHEWNHFADDVYGCDDSPGGDHSFFANTGDTELAWSEGYANYYQGVVRATNGDPNAHIYIDVNGGGNPGQANLESWNTISTTLNSVYNEGAIAAMLWDLQDGVNDGNDRVGYGHRVTQEVFTDPAFESNGDIFDDTCNVYVYLRAWQAMGKPATLDTAAAVSQNIGYTPPTFTGLMTAAAQQVTAAVLQTISAINVPPTALTTDYRWWKQLTWVVDNSTSMTGAKLDGTKTVINEQLNDLANDPRGVDFNLYTFNHESNSNRKIFENEFYADRITPAINGLAATNSFDLDCGSTVNGLQAAKGALVGKRAGDLWLFTDGIDSQSPRVDTLVQQLNRQQVKGSIALLGGCATPPADPNRLNGLESYVGNAAGPQSSGIVPYLVTALRSGGQFLYVSPDQLGLASDILRAQLANSAGAGRWSDYVSDLPLYRWDKLDANEYKWIDTSVAGGGTFVGQPYNRAIQVFFPQPFTIYGQTTSFGWVQDDGYILMGNQLNAPTLDVLYAPLNWKFRTCGPRMAASPEDVPCETPFVEVFTKQEGPWFAITTTGIGDTLADGPRAYQALLDSATGEIRYQYQAVESVDAGKAEIAVTDIANNQRMLVSNKDVNGAAAGMGYKFYWAPPQPAKTFDVAVDTLMEGVGFLLTGYSGDFEQMIVRTPDGNPVSCADTANVLCLNLGKVQYIQVNVNGRSGTWTATVDAAAPSNQGTFSFIATAASTVGAEVLTDHSLYSKGAHRILVKVGRTADNNVLTGWFQKPKGTSLGGQFALYDDGAHDDLFAGDGYFGSDPVTPGLGAAYL